MKFLQYMILFSLFVCFSAVSAKDDFTVFAAKGDLQLNRSGKGTYSKVNPGSKLNDEDILKVGNGAYISLLHKSGRTVEIKKSGDFSVAKLSGSMKSLKADLNEKVASFVINQISSSESMLKKSDYHKSMGVTGAVERSSAPDRKPGESIALKVPMKFTTNSNIFSCRWFSANPGAMYKFILFDRFDSEVFAKEITGNSIDINAEELQLEKDNFYYWQVVDASNPKISSERACFNIMSDYKSKSINEMESVLRSDMDNPESAINLFVLGGFYEQNYMIEEARACYQKASEAEPGVQEYKNYLTVFLEKNNFNN